MDGGSVLLVGFTIGAILLIIQRTEVKKRRGVSLFLMLVVIAVIWLVSARQIWGEALIGVFIAVLFNVLFWMLIGRYNPVGSSDQIRVMGLDD